MQFSFLLQALSLNDGGRAVHPIRWRNEYGGLKVAQAARLKTLEKENIRLKRLAADLSLERQVLKDVALGNL